MKKLRCVILRICIIAIFTFVIGLSINNVHAVDLHFEAEINPNEKSALTRTYVKSFTDRAIDWTGNDPTRNGNPDINIWETASAGSYRQRGYLFYGNYQLTDYVERDSAGNLLDENGNKITNKKKIEKIKANYFARHDVYVTRTGRDRIVPVGDNDDGSTLKRFSSREVYVVANNNYEEKTRIKDISEVLSNGTKNNYVYILRKKWTPLDGYYVLINDTVITAEYLEALVRKFKNKKDEAGNYMNRVGAYLKIGISSSLYLKDPNGNGKILKTGYDAICELKEQGEVYDFGWSSRNFGYNGNSSTPGSEAAIGASILNNYDNWLYIPLSMFTSRTVEIRYRVKGADGNWTTVKTVKEEFDSEAKDFSISQLTNNDLKNKVTLANGMTSANINNYYIGGKIVKDKTRAEALKKLGKSTNKWGWNQNKTISIGASEDEEYYIVNLYYDYRTISESHLKKNGEVINKAWNKVVNIKTKDSYTAQAKVPSIYYNAAKYVHVSTVVDNKKYNGIKVEFAKLNGENTLILGDNHSVKFYYEYEPPRKIYVRHFVYNDTTGNYERLDELTNSNAAIKDGVDNKYYLRTNGFNQRKSKSNIKNQLDKITVGFNEQYTIDFSDTIKLDKSRTIEDEGILYEYKGAKIQNNNVPNVLTTKAQANLLDKTKTNIELKPEKVAKTYVDFYYTQSEITPPGGDDPDEPPGGEDPEDPDDVDDEPTIDFVPKDDDGNEIGPDSASVTGECKVVYVPSGENLKAYMTASTYRPYSLIYDGTSINQTTGVISYTLKKYDAYKYVDGAVQNTNDSKYGYFNSTEKYGVFNTNSDTAVKPIKNVIDDVLKNSVTELKNLNPNTVTTVNDGRKTTQADFGDDNIHKVNYDKYNGVRKPSGIAYYNVTSLVKDGRIVFEQKKEKKGVDTQNNTQVNVFTPAVIKEVKIESEEVVNHSNQDTFVIQKNSEFKVTPVTGKSTHYKNISDTAKYIKYFWIVADFDVKLTDTRTVFNKDTNQVLSVRSGEIVRAGNLIQIAKGTTFSAIATNDETTGDIINQFSNKLKVVAVTYNVTDDEFEKKITSDIKIEATSTTKSLIDTNEIAKVTTSCDGESNKQSHSSVVDIGNSQVNNMYDDAHYFVEHTEKSKNIGRVYDLKVTDCLDVNFKNVFRKSNNGNVNDLRGIQYFSGIRRLLVYGGNGVQLGANPNNNNNLFTDRGDTINSITSKTILPLGPYKHIDTNYIQAPKLGYRISFDLKTSGMYVKSTGNSSVRYIKITPSYYYISKDGKTFNENISLYYKNSSGKYVNFEGSGYTIYFKPNDGYRTTYNPEAPELKDMSTKLEALKIGEKSFTLTDNMMSYSDNNFVQAWYGEFKLPNSTVVVEKGGNINDPLIDGYIGVRFNIECIDKETASTPEREATIVSYNQNDKTAVNAGMTHNTSQWDYEGYLGFASSNIGKKLNGELRMQLEKDFWRVNTQEMYEKVKSTVVLYDIDNRAANDFE